MGDLRLGQEVLSSSLSWVVLIGAAVTVAAVTYPLLGRYSRRFGSQRGPQWVIWASWVCLVGAAGILSWLGVLAASTPRWSYFVVFTLLATPPTVWFVRASLTAGEAQRASRDEPAVNHLTIERVRDVLAIATWLLLGVGILARSFEAAVGGIVLTAAGLALVSYLTLRLTRS